MPRAVTIRERHEGDVPASAAIAGVLRETDGYPAFLGDGDLEAFVTPSNMIAAWVALDASRIVGHVLLRRSSAPRAAEVAAAALGVDAMHLAFVARLMVLPDVRRRGIARALLATAADGARSRGLLGVLDVLVEDAAAIALYEAEGWQRLGQTTFTMRDGRVFEELVFAAPGAKEGPASG